MNFLAHGMLAIEQLHCPIGALASMAEDLAPLAGLQLQRDGAGPALRRGLAHHRRVDAAFHDAAAFKAANRVVAAALRDAGEDRWAAVAIAHVAVELLIDGSIPAPQTAALWDAVLDPAAVRFAGSLFAASDVPRWELIAEQWRAAGPPPYGSVAEVARRSVGAVSRRGRLRAVLAHQEVAALLDTLHTQAPPWPIWRRAMSGV
ncbi:MAG: hypothetical protein ACKV2O_03025 [Acidimicrobiales bacterium]